MALFGRYRSIRHAGEGVHAVRTRLVVKTDPGRTDPPFMHHQMQGVAAQGAFRLLTLDVVDDFARTDDVTLLVVVMVGHGEGVQRSPSRRKVARQLHGEEGRGRIVRPA